MKEQSEECGQLFGEACLYEGAGGGEWGEGDFSSLFKVSEAWAYLYAEGRGL